MKTEDETLIEIDEALHQSTYQMRKLAIARIVHDHEQDARHSTLSEAAELCAMAKYGSEYRPTENPSHIWKYTDEMEKAILALRDKKES